MYLNPSWNHLQYGLLLYLRISASCRWFYYWNFLLFLRSRQGVVKFYHLEGKPTSVFMSLITCFCDLSSPVTWECSLPSSSPGHLVTSLYYPAVHRIFQRPEKLASDYAKTLKSALKSRKTLTQDWEGWPCPAGQVRPQENYVKGDVDLQRGDSHYPVGGLA